MSFLLHQARFFTTVNHLRDLPPTPQPEIAFAGRSNAGKSTAMHVIAGLVRDRTDERLKQAVDSDPRDYLMRFYRSLSTGDQLLRRNELKKTVELAPWFIEAVEMLVGADVGLLHDVLGVGVIAEDRADGAVDALVVPPHQQLETRRLAGADAADTVRSERWAWTSRPSAHDGW